MTEKPSRSFQKTRDEAIRALVLHGGLTHDQVSALKLDQVHLATNTLAVEADEFAPSPTSSGRSFSLKLDGEMQRALIAWLVVRPDGPNDHLFPGTGGEGLDVATINQVVAAAEPKPPSAEREQVTEEPPPRPKPRYQRSPGEAPSPPTPPAAPAGEPEAVPLDEIEAMRKRLTEVYDAWAPAAPVEPGARPTPRAKAPSVPPVEVRPPTGAVKPEAPRKPAGPPPEEGKAEPTEAPRPRPEKTLIAKPVPTPPKEARAAAPARRGPGRLAGKPKAWLESSQGKITLNLSQRTVMIGALALVVVCCLGIAFVGGAIFRASGLVDLLAGATPSATPSPTPLISSPSPMPTPTATAPIITPSATPTAAPVPTDTPTLLPAAGPTPTPIVIVVTATPTPEPPPTAIPVPADTPVGSAPAKPTTTPTPTPAFKYPAPVLLKPEDGGVVSGVYAFLKWEPVGPLADDEWYTLRLLYLQQGVPVYQGDRMKVTEWRVPDRFYYQADGPALEYRWYVFIERDNPDGSATQISPESETFVFRWK